MGFRRVAWAAVAVAAMSLSACGTSINVQFDADTWRAQCLNVSMSDCDGIVRMFLNNLARNYGWVQQESGATVQVSPSTSCPTGSALGQPIPCWRANAPVRSSRACMIVARRSNAEQGYDFVWIGGDELTGRIGAPQPGSTAC
jgi:hypothetical protein